MRFPLLLWLCGFLAFFALGGWAVEPTPSRPASIPLTPEQSAWIAAHPAVTIALDDANPPLNSRQPDGSFAGISVDYLRLVTAKAGLELRLRGGSWNAALGWAMAHEVDGIMSASYKEDRRRALDFTAPYCVTPEAMVTAQRFPVVESLAGFAGRRIAVVAGTVRVPLLQQQVPTAQLIEVANAGEGLRALAEGRADGFFDDLPVIQEQVSGMMLGRLRVALLYFQPEAGAQRIGVRNDEPVLRAILDQAIAAITPDEHRAIRERWLHLAAGATVQRDLGLTEAERAWLAAHPVIRVGCDPEWAPVEWREANGQWRGISVEYLDRLQRLLGVRFVIDEVANWNEMLGHADQGRIDLIASYAETVDRRRSWAFSEPYLTFPIAIFARAEVGFLHGLEQLSGSRVAVNRGYVAEELMRKQFPGIILVPVDTTREGLEMLRRGQVNAYVGGLLTTAYRLQQEGDLSIHVVGETPYSQRQSFAIRADRPVLAGIIAKALPAITAEEREAIWRTWVTLTYQRAPDYSLLWKAGIPAALLLVVFWYWNRRLRAEIRTRTRIEAELIAYRDRLEELVRERTSDLEGALGRLRRLAAAIGQTAEAVVLATPEGRIEFVNPAFTRITGIATADAIGRDLATLGLPWSEPAVRLGGWRGPLSGERPDGAAYQLEAVVTAVNDAEGRLVDLLTVLRDVTASRQIEERLAQSQKLEAVGTLAGGIAHDFNNILAAILGAAELAERQGQSDERRRGYLARIITACERARSLVRQILAFARGSQGERQPLELAPVLREALALLRSSLPATIRFRSELAPGAVVLGDATRLHQILMNLGTNAGLAMPDGGELAVELAPIDLARDSAAVLAGMAPGPALRLTVSDTGVGMNRAVQARIFEPFFTTRPQGQGTGLGLAVVHGLVRDLGGTITVVSEPGQGTTFTIFLPRHAGEASAVRPGSAPLTGRGERILFVDDEPALRQNAEDLLTNLGYRVVLAADGAEALDLLRRDPDACDLLVTDTTMPRMTGIDLVVAARKLIPQLPVILCSGQGDPPSGIRPAGVRFLTKPITATELAAAIAQVLAG